MAYPARVKEKSSDYSIIQTMNGGEKKIKPCPVPNIGEDDYVLVHNKNIVQKISYEDFKKIKEEYSALKELDC